MDAGGRRLPGRDSSRDTVTGVDGRQTRRIRRRSGAGARRSKRLRRAHGLDDPRGRRESQPGRGREQAGRQGADRDRRRSRQAWWCSTPPAPPIPTGTRLPVRLVHAEAGTASPAIRWSPPDPGPIGGGGNQNEGGIPSAVEGPPEPALVDRQVAGRAAHGGRAERRGNGVRHTRRRRGRAVADVGIVA